MCGSSAVAIPRPDLRAAPYEERPSLPPPAALAQTAPAAAFTDSTAAIATVTFAPTAIPESYCTAGTTSLGCVPVISGAGTPSVSAPSTRSASR